jgi:hypothetical protein
MIDQLQIIALIISVNNQNKKGNPKIIFKKEMGNDSKD